MARTHAIIGRTIMIAPQDFKPGQIWQDSTSGEQYLITKVELNPLSVYCLFLDDLRYYYSEYRENYKNANAFHKDIFVREISSLEKELL